MIQTVMRNFERVAKRMLEKLRLKELKHKALNGFLGGAVGK